MNGVTRRAALLACGGLLTVAYALTESVRAADPAAPLDLEVLFEPTAFPSAGRTHLFYELSVHNAEDAPVTLDRIEVRDGAAPAGEPIAVFEGAALDGTTKEPGVREIAPGGDALVFLTLAFDPDERVPDVLSHRVVAGSSEAEGAVAGAHHTTLLTFAPPVRGEDWLAGDAPSNEAENHHRRGTMLLEGRLTDSRRYAIDWLRSDESGASYAGDPLDVQAYYSYDAEVFAVADGRVVAARNDLPDNVPRHNGVFQPAVEITMETVPGNRVVLDLGDGQFAHYFHLQPGSVAVREGDIVRRGQLLGRIGNSGDAREPHLHFEVTTRAEPLLGEGVPYVIDAYTVSASVEGVGGPRTGELPLNHMVVDFPDSATP